MIFEALQWNAYNITGFHAKKNAWNKVRARIEKNENVFNNIEAAYFVISNICRCIHRHLSTAWKSTQKRKKIFIERPKRREIENRDWEILQIQCVRKEFLWYNRRVEISNKTKILNAWSEGATKSDGKTSVVSACSCVYAVCTIRNHLWGLQWIAVCVHSGRKKKLCIQKTLEMLKRNSLFADC